MARRRGFFAELQHQSRIAAQQREQAARAAERGQAAIRRQAEQAQLEAERAKAHALRAAAAERKAAQCEAQRLHDEAMAAEVSARNAVLARSYEQIDTMLAATLELDDYVDLQQLRSVPQHPPFPHPELELPTPQPQPTAAPPEPVFVAPEAPGGLRAMFGKKRHSEQVAWTRASFTATHQAWQAEVAALPERQMRQLQEHQAGEAERLARLDEAHRAHRAECDGLDAQAADVNRKLDELIAGVQTGAEEAVQDYIGIVLSNSVYPEAFPVEHDFEFDSGSRELTLTVLVPPPIALPSEREYRYVKAKDEISATHLPKGEQRERYANAVYQVALRTLHEVFEADRAGWVQTISLTVASESIDPAIGLPKRTRLVAVPAERTTFMAFNLASVVPLATLRHTRALLSKNPFELVSIDDSEGVRRR